ncbi:vacuolar iron transporter homolog 2.1-like [Rosa rugosa]|uniref:vacuolar iron transporter homolog 2.1-like n=1 Tax=Rosa rugosa TaxID=74645 RepID=UPI002B40062D|nr:vacuolar iron transporter homolog 2.1-like [Rosa rugosa]
MAALLSSTRLLDPVVVDDIEEDRESFDNGAASSRPKEPWKAEYAKSILYAGLDAIVTCFSLISSISASRLTSADVLVLGFANLVADGISMGVGDFLSSSSEKDVAAKEMAVTEWDVTNHGGLEKMELLQKYQALGMDVDDAATVVSIFAKYNDILVHEKMMAYGRLPPEEAEKPWKNGLVTFAAFLVFGTAPLLSFIVLIPFTNSDLVKFVGACILSALALTLLGIVKAKIAGQNYAFSVVVTLFNGAAAAAAAYVVGWTLNNIAGLEG